MKYFIIGFNGSGKQEIVDILSSYNIKCGKLFTNALNPSNTLYNYDKYEQYSATDILNIFENKAYIFIQELQCKDNINVTSHKYFEGLSKYTFDNNEVFVLSPDQFISIPPCNFTEDICIIWVDNTRSNRLKRFFDEKRTYNFSEREDIEKRDIDTFVKMIYSTPKSHVIYFADEEPCRVAAAIYSMIKHPDLIEIYTKYLN